MKSIRYFCTIKYPVTLNNLCKLENTLLNFSGKTVYPAIEYLKVGKLHITCICLVLSKKNRICYYTVSIVATSDVWRVVYCFNCVILLKFIEQKRSLIPCRFDHVIFFKIRYTRNDRNTIFK